MHKRLPSNSVNANLGILPPACASLRNLNPQTR